MVPISFGDWKPIKNLGKGRFGVVKKVLHVPTNMHLAVKVSSIA